MLTSIELHNFKVHKNTILSLRPITILTGINGMGKSSVIQSLLLLRQSQVNGALNGLNLKGDLCNIGTAREVLCQDAEGDTIEIALSSDEAGERSYSFNLKGNKDNTYDTYLSLASNSKSREVGGESLYGDNFQYVSAFRFGPESSYKRDTLIVQQHKQISSQMGKCEYAVHFLYEFGETLNVLPELLYGDSDSTTLKDQVAYWMDAIAPDIMIKIDPVGDDLKLNFRYKREGKIPTRDISALNTGFGISYTLPLFVALLSAKPGALIIIENPEAHIHPKSQSVFMELVAKCAMAGIQVIIETHSDHIINGAMVAIHDGFPLDKIAVYYIERDFEEHVAHINTLKVQKSGRIVKAPKGFFDQIDIDLEHILGI